MVYSFPADPTLCPVEAVKTLISVRHSLGLSHPYLFFASRRPFAPLSIASFRGVIAGGCAKRISTPPLAPPVPLLHLQHSLEERILRTSSARVIGLVLRLSSLIIVVMLVPVPRPHVAPPAARPSCAYCMIPPAMGMQTKSDRERRMRRGASLIGQQLLVAF